MSRDHDPQHDPRSLIDLMNAALGAADEDEAWDAIGALHWRGTREVLTVAEYLCTSDCDHERRVGADILGQVGVPERTFARECADILFAMLETEVDVSVLDSIFVALSHLHDERAIPFATRFARHPDDDVRHAVVLALTGYEDTIAIQQLIRMTTDTDSNVRDWATFALGSQLELDMPEIRAALAARMTDPDDDTRAEALVGLASRGDQRVVAAIQRELECDSIGRLVVEAAELIASPDLLPALISVRHALDEPWDDLERAIAACSPSGSSRMTS